MGAKSTQIYKPDISYRYDLLAISFETFRIFRASFALNIWEISQNFEASKTLR